MLTWGDGGEGQLGHYPIERSGVMNTFYVVTPRELEGGGRFRSVACGQNHTLAIDEDGAVWSWGKSDYGKCGHGGDSDQEVPMRVEALAGVVAETVACGEFHSAVVDADGRLYTWGWGGSWLAGGGQLGHGDRKDQYAPRIVSALDDGGYRVKAVACGEAHTLILTDDGETLSCGAGEHGRNGNGASRDVLSPEPVDVLDDETVVSIDAGSAFSLALTERRHIYVWGRNDQAQLGSGPGLALDVYSMEDTPRLLELPEDLGGGPLEATTIAAGHSHAAAVSPDGRLFFWGMRINLEPRPVHFEVDYAPLDVYAGGTFTIVKAHDDTFHSFGLGRSGALGHGDRQGHTHPKHIAALDAYDVTSIACGTRHVAACATLK